MFNAVSIAQSHHTFTCKRTQNQTVVVYNFYNYQERKMFKFSRCILSVLILIAFFYKRVYSYNQILDNVNYLLQNKLHPVNIILSIRKDSEISNWKSQPKIDVRRMWNLLESSNNNDDNEPNNAASSSGHYLRDAWLKVNPGQFRFVTFYAIKLM